jgi:hypothetical protein
MEPSPSPPLEVAEPHLLLELLIVVLDAPAQLGVIDEANKANVLGKRREPVLGRLLFILTTNPATTRTAFAQISGGACVVA